MLVSLLAELRQHRIDVVESLVEILSFLRETMSGSIASTTASVPYLRTGEHDLARHEDEQHNLRSHHSVNETGE